MSANLETKKQIVAEVTSELTRGGQGKEGVSAVVFNYSKINVNELNTLKNELSNDNSKLRVVKNTLIKISLQKLGIPLPQDLEGQNAIISTQNDIVVPLKTLFKFVKDNERGQVVLGVLNGVVISGSQVEELSKLPSRQVLLGQVVGGFNGPIRSFVFALNDTQAKFVRVLNAVKESKGA